MDALDVALGASLRAGALAKQAKEELAEARLARGRALRCKRELEAASFVTDARVHARRADFAAQSAEECCAVTRDGLGELELAAMRAAVEHARIARSFARDAALAWAEADAHAVRLRERLALEVVA